MLVKIPRKFVNDNVTSHEREVYVNTKNIISIETSENVYDNETSYWCNINITNGFIPTSNMNEETYNEFIEFVDELVRNDK